MNPATIPGFMPIDAPNARARILTGPSGEVRHTIWTQPASQPDPHIEVVCFGPANVAWWCDRLNVCILKTPAEAGMADFQFYWGADRNLHLMPATALLKFTIVSADKTTCTKELVLVRDTNFDWLRLSHPQTINGTPTPQLTFPSC